MVGRNGKGRLRTMALICVPCGGLLMLLYATGRLAVRKRRAPAADPYEEWLTLRDLMPSRRPYAAADPRSTVRA